MMMDRGELPYAKVGKRRLIPRRALVELIERNLIGCRAAAHHRGVGFAAATKAERISGLLSRLRKSNGPGRPEG
jgi:hypothetical protein